MSTPPAGKDLSALPPAGKVDLAFDDLQRVLEQHQVATWTGEEAGQLAFFVSEFAKACRKRAREECSRDADEMQDSRELRAEVSAKLFAFLSRVRTHLRKTAPFGRHDDSIVVPQHSEAFPASTPTFEIDAFLFDEEDINDFVSAGKVSREYCKDCRSTNIGLTQFISHSFSQEQLVFVFSYALPMICKKPVHQLLDVGSRYGVVLAAAANASVAESLVGVEINPFFVAQQRQLFARLKINASVQEMDVVSDEGLSLLAGSDIVVLNNVFQWFAKEKDQLAIWRKIRQALSRSGQLLVVNPQLEESLSPLAAAFDAALDAARFISDWVEEMDVSGAVDAFAVERRAKSDDHSDDEPEHEEEELELARSIHFYRVK
jgi:hypothetical protein